MSRRSRNFSGLRAVGGNEPERPIAMPLKPQSHINKLVKPLIANGPSPAWNEWAWGVRTLLESEGLWDCVEGEQKPANVQPELDKKRNNQAACILMLHLGDKQRVRIMYQLKIPIVAPALPRARALWNEIAKTYCEYDGVAERAARKRCIDLQWDGQSNLGDFWSCWFMTFIHWETVKQVNTQFQSAQQRGWGVQSLKLFLDAVLRAENATMSRIIYAWVDEIRHANPEFDLATMDASDADGAGIARYFWEQYTMAVDAIRPSRQVGTFAVQRTGSVHFTANGNGDSSDDDDYSDKTVKDWTNVTRE